MQRFPKHHAQGRVERGIRKDRCCKKCLDFAPCETVFLPDARNSVLPAGSCYGLHLLPELGEDRTWKEDSIFANHAISGPQLLRNWRGK